MGSEFKDLFSTQAGDYARYRPHYPQALFRQLAKICSGHDLAWDVGTGSGQAALALAAHFQKVVATDPSEKQLAAAQPHPQVEYRLASAESSGLPDACADLVTVAQAFHWFRQEEFFRELRRVAKPGGRFALWCYELAVISPEVDAVVLELYRGILGPYWEKERKLVEEGYANVAFPFEELAAPSVQMGAAWGLADLIGYLGTWSALQKYRKERGEDPRHSVIPKLQRAWGDATRPKAVTWPLAVRVFAVRNEF